MKITITTILFFLQMALFAQMPILVADLNPGTADSFDDDRTYSASINGTTLFWLETENNGREMGYLQNGSLAILKDINPGEEDSNPFNYEIIPFKNQFYFPARTDSNNGSDLWVSDGTPEGTEVFDNGLGNIRGLTVSKSDLLYYIRDKILLATDGITIDSIFSDLEYNSAIQKTDHNICTYKEDIAFLRQASNNEIELYIVENGIANLKATKSAGSGFPQIFGMNQVGDDIVFVVNDPFNTDATGSFRYDAENQVIEAFKINGRDINRMHQFSEELALAYESQSGYYAVNGIEGEEVLLASASNVILTQNQDFIRGVDQDNIVLAAEQEFFGGSPILFSDGTTAETSILHDAFRVPPTSILIEGGFAFFIYEYAFKDYRLSYINMGDGTTGDIYDFDDTETGFEAFPMSVQDNKVYMAINFQEGLGLELYEIDTDINVAASQPKANSYTVDFTNQSFSVQSENHSPVKVSVFSTNGTLLENINTMTNTSYSLGHHTGLLFLRFELNGEVKTHQFFPR